MAIRHKRKDVSGYVWQSGDLVDGQLAINTADGTLHTKKSDGTVETFYPGPHGSGGDAPFTSIEYAGARIDPGATTTAANNGTDFGEILLGESVAHTFTLINRGADTITVDANAVTTTGAAAVTAQPSVGNLDPDESTVFEITVSPTAGGINNGTVSVATSDPVRSPYDFAVSGTATSEIKGDAAGGAGYGVSAPPIPAGFEAVDPVGYSDKYHAEFGNLQHINSGSVGVVTPAMGFKVESGNLFSSAYLADYNYDIAAMEADGYFLHHDFYQGGTEQNPGFVKFRLYDKYLCSKVAVGTGFVAASIKNGAPISTNASHNPIADITASAGVNAYYAAVRAPKGRDSANGEYDANSIWHCNTRQGQGLFWLMSLCHGQAATSTTYCSWYDPTGISNFPRGNDNNLASVDEPSLTWTGDGYGSAALTGSCSDPAKTSVNGQLCGIMEPGGNLYQVNIGITRGTDQAEGDTNYLVLKKHINPASLDWEEGGTINAWGTVPELSDRYELHDFPALPHNPGWIRFGDGTNQVIPANDPIAASLGLPIDPAALSAAGSEKFGFDGVYPYHRPGMCMVSGRAWAAGSFAGAGSANILPKRIYSNDDVGFRAACTLPLT